MPVSESAIRVSRIASWLGLVLLFPAASLIASTVSGVVTDAQSGATLSGMRVAAYGTGADSVSTATTNSKGKYSIDIPGEVRLVAYDDNGVYATSFAGGAESFDQSAAVSGDQQNYNFALIKGGRAGGSVATSDGGQPIPGLTVVAYNLSGSKRSSRITDPNGNYSMVLPPGTFKFVVYDETSPQRILPRFYNDRSSFELADAVSVAQGGNSASISGCGWPRISPERSPMRRRTSRFRSR
jgi:hypothetical protein